MVTIQLHQSDTDTPAKSSDINPIENLWIHLKKKVETRSPTNKNELMRFIKEEWEKYHQNMISVTYSCLQAVNP